MLLNVLDVVHLKEWVRDFPVKHLSDKQTCMYVYVCIYTCCCLCLFLPQHKMIRNIADNV